MGGMLDCVSSGQRKPMKAKKSQEKLKGDHQAQVHLGKMVLMVVRQGGWIAWASSKDSQGNTISDLDSQGGNWQLQIGPTGRDNLLFVQGW